LVDIFISYAREDRKRARILAKQLEDYGWNVWWDPKIPPGKTFVSVIKEAIEEANCVVVLWSKNSINSEWVHEEAAIAKRRGILVPANIEHVEPPLGFGLIQAADLTNWKTGKNHLGFESLINAISILIKPPKTNEQTGLDDEITEQNTNKQLQSDKMDVTQPSPIISHRDGMSSKLELDTTSTVTAKPHEFSKKNITLFLLISIGVSVSFLAILYLSYSYVLSNISANLLK
jgi:hypothetical protein